MRSKPEPSMGEVESQSVREWSSGRCRILTGRTTMRSRLNLVWLAVLLLLHCVGDGRSQLVGAMCDAYDMCVEKYETLQPELPYMNNTERCPLLQNTLDCLETHLCSGFTSQLLKGHLKEQMDAFMCQPSFSLVPTVTSTSVVWPTPSPPSCPSYPHTLPCDRPLGDCCPRLPPVLPPDCDLVQDLGTPGLQPPPALPECSVPESDRVTLQHCSMFTYSHVRPFGAYDQGIQTCSLPGSWYLLKHPHFSVEVSTDGERVSSSYGHTTLSKVNVTFFNHSCSEGRSYIAESTAALPYTFSDELASTSALHLWVNNGSTAASILATWLNTSIVIHSYAKYLSVTIQVPGKFIFDSEGLCVGGCLNDRLVDATEYIESKLNDCQEDNDRAGYHCYSAGVLNVDQQVFYGETCMFDAMKSGSLQVLSLLNATLRDAVLLPNVGEVPSLQPPSVTEGEETPSLQPPSVTEGEIPSLQPPEGEEIPQPTVPQEEPSDSTDSYSSSHHLYPSIHFVSVLVTLTAVLLHR